VAVDATLQSIVILVVPALTPLTTVPAPVTATTPGAVETTSLHGAAGVAAPTDPPADSVKPKARRLEVAPRTARKRIRDPIFLRALVPIEEELM